METYVHRTMEAFAPSGPAVRHRESPVATAREDRDLRIRNLRRNFAAVEDLRRFFGDGAGELVSVGWSVNPLDLLMAQRALSALLEGWSVVRECRYMEYQQDQLVQRMAVEVAPGRFDFLLREGRQFWQGPGPDDRLAVDIDVHEERHEEYSDLIFCIPQKEHGRLTDLLARARVWMDRHHFLRGQVFDGKGEFIRSDDTPGWDDVILPRAVREGLQRNVVDLLARRELFKANGIPLRRGIILHGPPGTGKTLIGRVLARTAGVTFILATPGMLEESEDVRRIFDWGRRWAPSILFFEDFDMVAGSRHANYGKDVLGEFLSCLDGVDSRDGVIAIATTNDLESIEPAIRDRPNRFDCILEVPALDRGLRIEYLRRWTLRRPAEIDIERWADATRNFTGAQLQELCRLAVIETIEARSGESADPEAVVLTVTDARMEQAIKRMSVKPKRVPGFRVDEE